MVSEVCIPTRERGNEVTKTLVPKLRFPEFRDAGEWREDTFGGAATFINGRAYKQDELLEQGKYRVLRVGNFFTNKEWYYSDLELEENKYCDNGDLLYAWSASFAPRIWRGEKVIYHYHIWKVIEKSGADKKFLFILLEYETERMKSQSANGLGLLHITKGTIEGWETHFPGLREQQKIADCLSSLDELITAHSQKHAALKAHKKGLMQQLFPAEGDDCMDAGGRATQDAKAGTAPKLRFPEFQEAGEWEEKSLGDVCFHFKGFAFKSIYYTASGRRVVRVSDMGFDYIKNETSAIYIKEDKANLYEKWKLVKDDLIITTVGSKPPVYDSLVGRTIVVELKDEGSLLNQNAVCLRANKNIEQGFLNVLFKREEYISFIESIIRGNANQGSIALVDLFKYIILRPKPKEQQKIADCLSSLDDLITAQAKKIDSLKAHKKGLMQQLFPAVDEVNA